MARAENLSMLIKGIDKNLEPRDFINWLTKFHPGALAFIADSFDAAGLQTTTRIIIKGLIAEFLNS